jgi:hypothetical protein
VQKPFGEGFLLQQELHNKGSPLSQSSQTFQEYYQRPQDIALLLLPRKIIQPSFTISLNQKEQERGGKATCV